MYDENYDNNAHAPQNVRITAIPKDLNILLVLHDHFLSLSIIFLKISEKNHESQPLNWERNHTKLEIAIFLLYKLPHSITRLKS